MTAHRRTVAGFARDHRTRAIAALRITCNPVAVAFGVKAGIDKLACRHGRVIAAIRQDLLQKQHGALLEFAHLFAQRPFLPHCHQIAESVESHQRLARGVYACDVVVVPGDVASLVRCNGALDVRRGEPRDQGIEHMGDAGLQGIGLHITRVLLGPETIVAEQLAQRHGIGQIKPQLRRRRCGRRHGGQGNQVSRHAGGA